MKLRIIQNLNFKGNRAIKEKRSLIESIEKSGILVPIDVNEKFEIIDGQTRFDSQKIE